MPDDKVKFDFGGYATRADVLCSDGRKIVKHAFKGNYGKKVPLVWQHVHDDPSNVLGHAILEDRDGDVYAFGIFNNTPAGQNAKNLVAHGDVVALSIFANQLVEKDHLVHSGNIREVSLVLAGANPGALIDYINLAHSDGEIVTSDSEAVIYMNSGLELSQADAAGSDASASDKGETVEDVFNTLTPKQKDVVFAMITAAVDEAGGVATQSATKDDKKEDDQSIKQGETVMKQNVFDGSNTDKKPKATLTHAQFSAIMEDAKKTGSFKQAFLAHVTTYGIENIDYLFPDARAVGDPAFVKRDMGWVTGFMNSLRKSPFSRIKSLSADITADTARAKGYIKGNLKKEEFFALSKRVTTPTTIYKKQKLDRDDIIDITDMDVVAWLKTEMRWMLDEEIARAVLVGDGRAAENEDKINPLNIRPIYTDDDFYAYHVELDSALTTLQIIDEIIRVRKEYKGTGNPTMYVTSEFLTDMLLLRDQFNHRLYNNVSELAAELRVSSIVEVPVMSNLTRTVDGGAEPDFDADLLAIIVNGTDFVLGADKGGAIALFDDFDIDYNQYKYLMETRCSGALVLPRAALVIEKKVAQG